MKSARKGIARVAGVGVAAAAAVGHFAVGVSAADTFVPLPGGDITETIDDGTVVHVTLGGESANINPSMGATPLHRNVWTSGHGEVDLSAGAAGDPKTYTKLRPGYVVGCQVDLSSGITPGANGTASTDLSSDSPSITTKGGASASLSIGAGQAKTVYLLDLESADDYGSESHSAKHKVMGPHNSVTWKDETINVDGCGGYAQARAFVQAMVYTPTTIGYVTVWGQPFSLG
ncbi:MspA family porin [Nocardia sp. CA-119907]|uniref:MspA family porin n=1 Tax=Nocardia sp. CA-119907 TaxID=3239973 RepID=UPI003D9611B9